MSRRSTIRTRGLTAVLLAVVAMLWPPPAAAEPEAGDGYTAKLEGCTIGGHFLTVPMARVQTRDGVNNDLVPEHYVVRSDTGGATANLLVNPFACDTVTAGGTTGPARGAYVTVEIERPPGLRAPETCPAETGDPHVLFDEYVLFMVTDSQPYADWLRAGTGFDVTYVPDISYDFTPPAGTFFFEAPSIFTVEGVASAQSQAGPVCVEDNWWQDTRSPDGKRWTVRFNFPPHVDYFASADVTITAEEGSELADVMGGTTGKPYASLPHVNSSEQVKTVTRNCTPVETRGELRSAQQGVLDMLARGTADASDDLTTVRDEQDLAELAALGYDFYPHHQSSIEGMGWPVLDTFTGPAEQTAARPQLLLYEPSGEIVTAPRDGFDFPYRLRGWAYPTLMYEHAQHPVNIPGLQCMQRDEWFVHERGIHTFYDGDFVPYPPEEEIDGEKPHGTARGDDTVSLTPHLKPGDFPHERSWDLHVWCSPDCVTPTTDVPTVSMLNPGPPILGLDPNVGVSPPPNWPEPPYPAFFYPPG